MCMQLCLHATCVYAIMYACMQTFSVIVAYIRHLIVGCVRVIFLPGGLLKGCLHANVCACYF